MKLYKLSISVLVCLAVLSGCGKGAGEPEESVVSGVSDEGAEGLSESGAAKSEPGLVSESREAEPGSAEASESWEAESDSVRASESQMTETAGSRISESDGAAAAKAEDAAALSGVETSETAQTAYAAFLEGDISLFDSEGISMWGLEDWKDTFLFMGELEYVCLDLDGDGIEELLVQWVDDPCSFNGVFHYENDRLSCWQFDGMEGNCRDYPLQDGTMVRQYDYGGSSTYTLFRYGSDGETEELSGLFLREELPDPDSDSPCPYYEVDGKEVDKAVFEEQLKELVTDQMLERSAWTGI